MKHFFLLPGQKYSVKIDPDKESKASEQIAEPLYPFEHDINTSDGSEFLDDAIRMTDQPLGEIPGTNNQ